MASARAGRLVALCDFDLRKPGLSQLFRLRSQVGLTNVLTTSVSADDALEEIDLAGADEAPGLTGNPNKGLLSVFGSGPLPPNPGDFVVAPGVTKLFDTLRDSFDLVLVDTPAVAGRGRRPRPVQERGRGDPGRQERRHPQGRPERLRQGLEDARTPLLGFVMVNWRPGGADELRRLRLLLRRGAGGRPDARHPGERRAERDPVNHPAPLTAGRRDDDRTLWVAVALASLGAIALLLVALAVIEPRPAQLAVMAIGVAAVGGHRVGVAARPRAVAERGHLRLRPAHVRGAARPTCWPTRRCSAATPARPTAPRP